jgi:hypothetical protein
MAQLPRFDIANVDHRSGTINSTRKSAHERDRFATQANSSSSVLSTMM